MTDVVGPVAVTVLAAGCGLGVLGALVGRWRGLGGAAGFVRAAAFGPVGLLALAVADGRPGGRVRALPVPIPSEELHRLDELHRTGSLSDAEWAAARARVLGAPATPALPGWHLDPFGRHQARWWDGQAWTAHVGDVLTDGTPRQGLDRL